MEMQREQMIRSWVFSWNRKMEITSLFFSLSLGTVMSSISLNYCGIVVTAACWVDIDSRRTGDCYFN